MKKELFQACIFNSANLEVSGTEMFDFRRKSLERGELRIVTLRRRYWTRKCVDVGSNSKKSYLRKNLPILLVYDRTLPEGFVSKSTSTNNSYFQLCVPSHIWLCFSGLEVEGQVWHLPGIIYIVRKIVWWQKIDSIGRQQQNDSLVVVMV